MGLSDDYLDWVDLSKTLSAFAYVRAVEDSNTVQEVTRNETFRSDDYTYERILMGSAETRVLNATTPGSHNFHRVWLHTTHVLTLSLGGLTMVINPGVFTFDWDVGLPTISVTTGAVPVGETAEVDVLLAGKE